MSNTTCSQAEFPDSENVAANCAGLPDIDSNNEQAECLKKRADALMADYAESHSAAIVEDAISVFEEVLRLRPIGHEYRAEALRDLGMALFFFCHHNATGHSRRNRCFYLLREALQLCPPGHSLRDQALHNLARALYFVGCEQSSRALDNLRESILLNRAALQLRPAGHPTRVNSLNNLACGLERSFQNYGDLGLLGEAIAMHREVLQLLPLGHPLRASSLINLALALQSSFEHRGGSETLAEAVTVAREALQLRPVGHPMRWVALGSLGLVLWISFESQGFPELLSEAISLQYEVLQLVSSDHPERGSVLNHLAKFLMASFRLHHSRSVLAEVITLLRQSLCLPVGADRHSDRLNGLAEALIASFDAHEQLEHLREAEKLLREALVSRPRGHFRRTESSLALARLLCRNECHSWKEALALFHEALDICPTGSPLRAEVLSGTSRCFLDPASPFFDLAEGVKYLSAAYSDNFCHVNRRLRSAMSDLPRVESAYTEGTASLHGSTLEQCNIRVVDLYAQVIGLLPRAANFGLDHNTRLQAVTGLDEIARDAAARAVLIGRESQAVEMLEEGRGVFWAQTLHLRVSAFDSVPDEDRQELQRLLGLLDHSARRVESVNQSTVQRERDLEKRRQLNEEAEALIIKIRAYAGLERFLLPPTFDGLIGALPDGFVVIVNASKLGHHALLLHRTRRLATSLTLQPPPSGFDSATLSSHLPRNVVSDTLEGDTRAMRKVHDRSGSFMDVLSVLWTSIFRPVVTQLGLQKLSGRARPRLWWCATGELGFLPIHAAGNYREASRPECVADYVTSSYVPTLASLTKTRSGWRAIPRAQLTGLLVCEESWNSERARFLPQAAKEVYMVRDCFNSAHAHVLNDPSAHTSLLELQKLLVEAPSHILHLACHGIHASDPLNSALVLQDGNLTIQDIMNLHLPNAVLAVLSACQTAKGDRNAPDQAIHLAASMLFCGFRSVIGTMWLMHDEDGPKVARAFYEALFQSEALDLDDVPYALDEAVQALRKAGVPAQRWALFMHMGG